MWITICLEIPDRYVHIDFIIMRKKCPQNSSNHFLTQNEYLWIISIYGPAMFISYFHFRNFFFVVNLCIRVCEGNSSHQFVVLPAMIFVFKFHKNLCQQNITRNCFSMFKEDRTQINPWDLCAWSCAWIYISGTCSWQFYECCVRARDEFCFWQQ